MDSVTTRIHFLICVTALTAASCSPSPPPPPEPHIPTSWSYDGESGPAHWNTLDREYATCGFGTTQSPVDITNAKPEHLPAIVFHYQPSRLKIQNTGHTIQVDVDEGSSIEVNGGIYDLLNIQVHAPSEHTIDGKSADAELQLVHRNSAGELAIIAVLLRIGREDNVLRDVWNNLPRVPGPGKTIEEEIHLEEILPPHRRTWRYEGSLTTPPCAEVASWLVMHDAMHVGAKQLARFTGIFKMNNRPVQPLNHRTILQDSSSDR